MAKIHPNAMDTLRLIQRSPDLGDGWRSCSDSIWDELIAPFPHPELLELVESARHKFVRLSEKGQNLLNYL